MQKTASVEFKLKLGCLLHEEGIFTDMVKESQAIIEYHL